LNVPASIHGTSLGTTINNRGILNTNSNTLSGLYFKMNELSHLKITSLDGISIVGQVRKYPYVNEETLIRMESTI